MPLIFSLSGTEKTQKLVCIIGSSGKVKASPQVMSLYCFIPDYVFTKCHMSTRDKGHTNPSTVNGSSQKEHWWPVLSALYLPAP